MTPDEGTDRLPGGRLAAGARPADVLALVLRQGMLLGLAGVARRAARMDPVAALRLE